MEWSMPRSTPKLGNKSPLVEGNKIGVFATANQDSRILRSFHFIVCILYGKQMISKYFADGNIFQINVYIIYNVSLEERKK